MNSVKKIGYVEQALLKHGYDVQDAIDYLSQRDVDVLSKEIDVMMALGTNRLETVTTLFSLYCSFERKPNYIVFSGGIGHNMPGNDIIASFVASMAEKKVPYDYDSEKRTMNFLHTQKITGKQKIKKIAHDVPRLLQDVHETYQTEAERRAAIEQYVSEADIYLEFFLALYEKEKNKLKNILVVDRHFYFKKNDVIRTICKKNGLVIFLENTSTNSGLNVIYSKRLLEQAGLIANEKEFAKNLLVIQEPFAHKRALATVAKWFGTWPHSYAAYQPVYEEGDKKTKQEYLAALAQEFVKINKYSKPQQNGEEPFIIKPYDFKSKEIKLAEYFEKLYMF